jgi:hypothetical protein
MLKAKRLWGILGSVSLVLLIGLFQSSAHATPVLAILPAVPIVAPASVNSMPINNAQLGSISQSTPLSRGMAFLSKPENVLNNAVLAGQLILAIYGLCLACAGRGMGKAATKSTANVVWGVLFMGIAATAPQLVGWSVDNSKAEMPNALTTPALRVGGCG